MLTSARQGVFGWLLLHMALSPLIYKWSASVCWSGGSGMTRRVPPDPDVGAAFAFAEDLPLTREAISFAQEHHSCQRRPADGAPFLLHPLEVASMLERSSYPDQVIAAAVLHDVLEDTDAERSDLMARFGGEVAELVALVSDDSAIDDEEQRKDDVRDRVRRAGGDALVVYAADKVSKVRELRMLLAAGLDQDAATVKLRRYRKSLAMLEQASPNTPLVELLRFEVEALETLPPEQAAVAAR
jgi:(p)ppGpp synthase/HD superfamily hydrolase